MDAATRRLIEALHQSPVKCVLAVTGGGAGAAGLLLNVPGGSRTVLEIQVPYHEQALVEFLGARPETFCSPATARAMAVRAFQRGRWLAPLEPVVGVGCTASLATDRPKRGDHRFHLAVRTAERLASYSLTLSKGAREREAEEAVLDAALLNALAEGSGVTERLAVPLLEGEAIQVETSAFADPVALLLSGRVPAVCAESDGRLTWEASRPGLVVPGAFNPVHEGHWGLAAAASRLTGRPAAFELSVVNVDKPPLSAEEVRRRLHALSWRAPLWLTRAPTFVEKADLFPGAVFAVGADTAARIVSPRYYGNEEARMLEALDHIRRRRCRFLVAGRVDAADRWISVAELGLPPACRDLFAEIPEAEFRLDISSTRLRAQGSAPS